MRKQRLKPDDRRLKILEAAVPLAEANGYDNVTRKQVAEAAGVSGPILNYHFGTMSGFKGALLQYAIDNGVLKVAAQAALKGVKMPTSLRRQALDSLL